MTRVLSERTAISLVNRRINPDTVKTLFERITRKTGGNGDINRVSVVAFHYGFGALTNGKNAKPIKHTSGIPPGDIWARKPTAADRKREQDNAQFLLRLSRRKHPEAETILH